MLFNQLWACLAFFILGTSFLLGLVTWSWPDSYTHVIFCDVGQGDATLIINGFTQVLIDSGRDDKALNCINKYVPWWDLSLELVVSTHADADHIGGFPEVFQRYNSKYILIDLVGKPGADFLELRTSLISELRQGSKVVEPFLGQIITVSDDIQLKTLSPRVAVGTHQLLNQTLPETTLSALLEKQSEVTDNYNDGSIVQLLKIGEVQFLLTGDLEAKGEQALNSRGVITDIDLLKVGHHGSKTSTTPEFLAQARPEISVISCGKNNSYGHPAPSVLKLLEEEGVAIVRTDQLGDIEFISDGTRYWSKELKTQSFKEQRAQTP